jgi:hypothetical protein
MHTFISHQWISILKVFSNWKPTIIAQGAGVIHSQFCASQNRSAAGLLQLVVNKPMSGCVRSPCTCLSWQVRNGVSTGLWHAVTVWQSCSIAVFNRPVARFWHRAAAMLFSATCDRHVVNPGKHLTKLRVSTILNKKWPNRLPYFGCTVS